MTSAGSKAGGGLVTDAAGSVTPGGRGLLDGTERRSDLGVRLGRAELIRLCEAETRGLAACVSKIEDEEDVVERGLHGRTLSAGTGGALRLRAAPS